MDNTKGDNYFAEKLKADLAFIVKHTENISKEELKDNEILLDSMLFRLIQISESSSKLSEKYKSEHKSVPWKAIYGLRNRIVHDYGNVDLDIVYSTLKNDISQLIELLNADK